MKTRNIFLALIILLAPVLGMALEIKKEGHLRNLEVYDPEIVPETSFEGEPENEGEKAKLYRLEDFRGKLVILNFWATWCVPCILEMPSLNNLQKEMGAEFPIEVAAISEDFKGMDSVKDFYKNQKIDKLKVYMDINNQLFGAFGVKTLPTTIFIDANGKEVARVKGEVNWGTQEVRDFIKSLM